MTRTFAVSRSAHFVRCLTAVTALASFTLITACGGEPEPAKSAEDKGVASVTQPGDKQSQTPEQSPAQAERPLIRPDTTEEEEWRLVQVHQECQALYGLEPYMIKNDDGSWKGYKGGNDKLWKEALKACASKEPEPLPARVAKEDPNWKDKYRKWLKCMESHGMDVEPTWDTPGYFAFTHGLPPVSKTKWIKKCEAEAYVVE